MKKIKDFTKRRNYEEIFWRIQKVYHSRQCRGYGCRRYHRRCLHCGAFITAIINFLLIAIVLFCIVKLINNVHDNAEKQKGKFAPLTKDDVKAFRREGKTTDEILKIAADKKAAEEEAARKAAEEAAANAPKTEQELLGEIVELLKEKK